jgi:glycosyltransferase involved in cell wall biosynthesis
LSIGTIEGRKNHLALLDACEILWREGLNFELHLIGLARPDTAGRALDKIKALQHAGHPLLYKGVGTNEEIAAAYGQCSFTVYPSLIEGFGLPVLESVGFGKPCICSAHGALGESSRDGGCVGLDSVDARSLTTAIKRLLQHPKEVVALASAARARRFKNWSDYAGDIAAWMQTVPRRV